MTGDSPVPLHPTTYDLRPSEESGLPLKPRFWEERAPQENWNKNIPSVAVPSVMYEALQEMSVSPDFEYGGRMGPVIRQALEEFLVAHPIDSARGSMFRQMVEFRDSFVEEVMASEFLNQVQVIDTSLNRWRHAGEVEQLVALLNKVTDQVKKLPTEWRSFVLDQLRLSPSVREGFEYVYQNVGHDEETRKVVDVCHAVVYG